MAIDIGYTIFSNLLENTTVFGWDWVYNLIATFLTLLALTRDINQWRMLALPVMVGWTIVGLQVNILIIIVAIVVFVVENLSLQTLGKLINIRAHTSSVLKSRQQSAESILARRELFGRKSRTIGIGKRRQSTMSLKNLQLAAKYGPGAVKGKEGKLLRNDQE